MARYRHYKNRGGPQDTIFATTTALDFAHVLRRPEMKDIMVHMIISQHKRYGATLHAFVVMNNHFHLVSQMPETRDSSWFMQRLKEKSAKTLVPLLSERERHLLGMQVGLDKRQCWQRSFDSIVIFHTNVRGQKTDYIHLNPIRAGIVDSPEEYRWSSARLYARGLWTPDTGLDLDGIL